MARARKKKRTASASTPPAARNYIAIADAFAREAISDVDQARHCKWVRLAASRYLKDRARATEQGGPFKFSKSAAVDACEFIEKLPHVEGRWETEDVVMHPAHVFFVVNLFGFRLHDGARRFTSALLCIGRKNAKSWLAAAILLYCFCCEDEPGAQIISAATTGDQARKIFDPAQAIVNRVSDLREAFGLEPFSKSIVNWEQGSHFKPINAKASTQDGLNPSHIGLDEIHAHKNHDLLNVLRSAAGARRNTLWLYTTTEGYENPGPWGDLRHVGQQVLQGVFEMDHFFFLLFQLDVEEGKPGAPNYRPADSVFDESKWVKANPLLDVNPVLLSAIRKHAAEAKQMPGQMAEFRIKRCNLRSSSANVWVDFERWKRCGMTAIDLDFLEGKPCWGGLDLASNRDLTAFRLVWRIDGVYYTWGIRWVPKWAIDQRTERGTVRYDGWVEQGCIRQTEGDVTDYAVVERDVVDAFNRFQPTEIAFDKWNAQDLVNRLVDKNLPMVEFRQGGKSYHPAMQELERAYIGGKLQHGNDPVLNWCASNLVPRYDENMNMAPDRKRSADKIDDMCALLMPIGRALVTPEPKKQYQVMFV